MLLKCPFCGASVDHDPASNEGPVCPGCNLKLTGVSSTPADPTLAPPVVRPDSAAVSPLDLLAPVVVDPVVADPAVTDPAVADRPSAPSPPGPIASPPVQPPIPSSRVPSSLVPPGELASPPVVYPPTAPQDFEKSPIAKSIVPPPFEVDDAKVIAPSEGAPPIASPADPIEPIAEKVSSHQTNDQFVEDAASGESARASTSSDEEPVQAEPADATDLADAPAAEHSVLIPSADGGFVPVDQRFTHVEHRGKKIELLHVSHEQRHTSRRIRSTIIFVGCLIFLAAFMIWLSKYLQ